MIMKKYILILLSVTILIISGCNQTEETAVTIDESPIETTETETTERMTEDVTEDDSVIETDISTTETSQNTTTKGDETSQNIATKDVEAGVSKSTKNTESSQNTTSSTEASQNASAKDTEASQNATTKSAETGQNTSDSEAVEEKQQSEPETTETAKTSYNPNTVVSLAISKCKAGGMITTQDNLANALAEGRITKEEYDEYYPYDGLESSYYSVFVETDLNVAGTLSGRSLRSEDAIATYIADMLLLENGKVFNIVYAGVYTKNGTDFYEFRCLR